MDFRKHDNARINGIIRRLVAAGNMAALVASNPELFTAETRQTVIEAWNQTLEYLRKNDIYGDKNALTPRRID